MAKLAGKDWLLEVWNGAAYKGVGGIRDAGGSISNEQVDVTDKYSNGNREGLAGAGVTSMTISGSGLFDKDSTAAGLIESNAAANTQIKARLISSNGDIYECASWDITQFERTGTYNDAEQVNITLESAAPLSINGTLRAVTDPDA